MYPPYTPAVTLCILLDYLPLRGQHAHLMTLLDYLPSLALPLPLDYLPSLALPLPLDYLRPTHCEASKLPMTLSRGDVPTTIHTCGDITTMHPRLFRGDVHTIHTCSDDAHTIRLPTVTRPTHPPHNTIRPPHMTKPHQLPTCSPPEPHS